MPRGVPKAGNRKPRIKRQCVRCLEPKCGVAEITIKRSCRMTEIRAYDAVPNTVLRRISDLCRACSNELCAALNSFYDSFLQEGDGEEEETDTGDTLPPSPVYE